MITEPGAGKLSSNLTKFSLKKFLRLARSLTLWLPAAEKDSNIKSCKTSDENIIRYWQEHSIQSYSNVSAKVGWRPIGRNFLLSFIRSPLFGESPFIISLIDPEIQWERVPELITGKRGKSYNLSSLEPIVSSSPTNSSRERQVLFNETQLSLSLFSHPPVCTLEDSHYFARCGIHVLYLFVHVTFD